MVSWESATNPCVMNLLCDLSANEGKQGSGEFALLLQHAFTGIKANSANGKRQCSAGTKVKMPLFSIMTDSDLKCCNS